MSLFVSWEGSENMSPSEDSIIGDIYFSRLLPLLPVKDLFFNLQEKGVLEGADSSKIIQ